MIKKIYENEDKILKVVEKLEKARSQFTGYAC